jgi:hypothetical protein
MFNAFAMDDMVPKVIKVSDGRYIAKIPIKVYIKIPAPKLDRLESDEDIASFLQGIKDPDDIPRSMYKGIKDKIDENHESILGSLVKVWGVRRELIQEEEVFPLAQKIKEAIEIAEQP